MKKKVFLTGVAAAAAVASLTLVSCGGGSTPTTTTTTTGGVPTTTTTAPTESKVDVFLNYNGNKGITFRSNDSNIGSTHSNPIDGITYKQGDLLPTWKAYEKNLNVKFNDITDYSKTKNDDVYKQLKEKENGWTINGEEVDLFYNSVSNIIDMGGQKVVNLKDYINAGKMPNFKAYLDAHPEMLKEFEYGTEKAIYFTPYFDGYNDIEKVIMMDTHNVEILLDADLSTLPATLGQLSSGHGVAYNTDGANKDRNTLAGDPQVKPFIDADHNYPTATTTVKVNNGATSKDLTITQTTNIIKQQNVLLAAGTTGRALLKQMQDYLDTAFAGQIGSGKTYAKRSEIFTSIKAAYNTDELLALMRVFKANPDILYYDLLGDAAQALEQWTEVEGLFPRGADDTRIQDNLTFFGNIYGVQGIGSEKDHLFFTADGKIHDAETVEASYEMLGLANRVYQEHLMKNDFYSNSSGKTEYVERYFKHNTADKSSFGLVMYDYIATQSAANDKQNGLGTDKATRTTNSKGASFANYSVTGVKPILSPLTYWATETSWTVNNNLADENGTVNTAGKTLIRYYEENRALKTDAWCIPMNSDNKEGAVKVIDYMFSDEGNTLQNYGPSEYWTTGTIFGKSNPVLKTSLYEDYAGKGDIWNYLRGVIGSTLPIGHVRPTSLDYQVTNAYSQQGYTDIQLAVSSGVQHSSLCKTTFGWDTTLPTTCYPVIAQTTSKTYEAITNLWSKSGKKAQSANGWTKAIVDPAFLTDDTFVIYSTSTASYTKAQIEELFSVKNLSYLAQMTQSVNATYGVDAQPTEAKQQ